MKKVLIIMMAVLLIGALFISCSNEVEKDTLGKVSISFDDSRSIKTSVTSSVKSVNELVWFYTATKTSGLYATGQTSSLTIVPAYNNNSTAGKLTTGTSLGDFSTGSWKFSFYGFNEAADSSDLTKAVYYSIDIPVRVEGEGQVAVRIVLNEGEVDLGKVVFDDLSIDLNAFNGLLRTGGTLSLDIFMNEETETGKVATVSGGPVTTAAVYNLTPAAEKTNLQAGTYEFIFVLNYTTDAGLETEETVEVARESKTVVIANGTIITFSGDILKTNTLKNVVIGDITEGENKAQASFVGEVPTEQTTVSVAVSPASASDTSETIANTKVTFPENVLATAVNSAVDDENEELTSSKVTIEVTSTLEATTKFEIKATNDSNAFAGINLDLWKTTTQENVETTAKIDNPTFTSPVTVETYIAKGLTGVTVEYQGDSELSHPVASNDQAKIEAQQADEYDTDAELGDKLGYSRDSGLLRFTTTHFSEFAVGADQNVYDKTSNTAYILSDLTANDMNSEHEYVLLDSRLANTVPDAIDNFNAGYRWSAIHPSDEAEDTTNFVGGYGTKIEPYLIANLNHWNSFYQIVYDWEGEERPYFKLIADVDCSGKEIKNYAYKSNNDKVYGYDLEFALNGDNHKIIGIEDLAGYCQLFPYIRNALVCNITIDYNLNEARTAAMVYSPDGDNYFTNVTTTGRIETTANWATAYVAYMYKEANHTCNVYYTNCKNYANIKGGYGNNGYTAVFGSHNGGGGHVTFDRCENHGGLLGGYVGFVGMGNDSAYTFVDSDAVKNFGSMSGTKNAGYFNYDSTETSKTIGGVTCVVKQEGSSAQKSTTHTDTAPENFGAPITINAVAGATTYEVQMSLSIQVYNYDDGQNANRWSGGFPRSITRTYSASDVVEGKIITDFVKGYVGEIKADEYHGYGGSSPKYEDGVFVYSDFDFDSVVILLQDQDLYLVKDTATEKTFYVMYSEDYPGWYALLTTNNEGVVTLTSIPVSFSVTAYNPDGSVLSFSSFNYGSGVNAAKEYFNPTS